MCHSEESKTRKPVLNNARALMRSFTLFRMTLRVRFFASLRMTGKVLKNLVGGILVRKILFF
jgi:hypothetical protein